LEYRNVPNVGKKQIIEISSYPRLVFEDNLEAIVTLEEEALERLEAITNPLFSRNFNFYYSTREKVVDRDLLKAINNLSCKPTMQPGRKGDRFYYIKV
jgi:hypothetical protein